MNRDAHSVAVCDFSVFVNGRQVIVRRVSTTPDAVRAALRDAPDDGELAIKATPVPNSERRVSSKRYHELAKAGKDPFDDEHYQEEQNT